MKVRQRVCFHSSGNRSSRGRSEYALLCRTVAPHEDHEVIAHVSNNIALCQCGLKTRLYGSSASRHLLSAREPVAAGRKREGTPFARFMSRARQPDSS
jgi:hypothetical protein